MSLACSNPSTRTHARTHSLATHTTPSLQALSSRFLKEGATNRQVLLCVGPFTLVAPLAVLAGAVVRDVDPLLTLVLSCFATGTFLYVGMSEIVEVRTGIFGQGILCLVVRDW